MAPVLCLLSSKTVLRERNGFLSGTPCITNTEYSLYYQLVVLLLCYSMRVSYARYMYINYVHGNHVGMFVFVFPVCFPERVVVQLKLFFDVTLFLCMDTCKDRGSHIHSMYDQDGVVGADGGGLHQPGVQPRGVHRPLPGREGPETVRF